MAERKYTMAEIDRMRAGIRRTIDLPRMVSHHDTFSGTASWTPETVAALEQHERTVEDRLRTALVAGVDPEEFPELKPWPNSVEGYRIGQEVSVHHTDGTEENLVATLRSSPDDPNGLQATKETK